LVSGLGNDTMRGGDGFDTLSYELVADGAGGVDINLSHAIQRTGVAGKDYILEFENVLGSRNNDRLTGDLTENDLQGG
ncbi:hypothetical protein NL476_28460, partial [Klebsiella pneumoniae]|nr:hypothetical protein [Klebsiella pneumoniae]